METKKLIGTFFKILSLRRKQQLLLLLLLMIISSIAELFSFSLLFPFITALTNPTLIFEQRALKPLLNLLNIRNDQSLQLKLTFFFSLSVFLSMIIRILSLWANVKLSFKMGSDIGYQMFEKILKRPYKEHIYKNSNEVINGITYKSSQIIYGGFLPLITVISNAFLVLSILIPLLYFYPYVTISMAVFLAVIYINLAFFYKKTLLLNGHILSNFSTSIMRTLKESLISIRDLILDGTQSFYLNAYKSSDRKMKDALGSSQFIGLSPRYFIESLSIILIAIFSYSYISRQGDIAIMLPLLGSFLLAFQRLLPAAQQIYNNWTAFLGNKVMMEEVIETLLLKDPEYGHIQDGKLMKFDSSIKLEHVSFKYNEAEKIVLNNINLSIKKGEKVAIIGGTGNGKSTLIDIIMGLLEPTEGYVSVDSLTVTGENMRAWQLNIAHVPQTINLIDASISENIAFGLKAEEIDQEKVQLISQLIFLEEFIDKKENSYNQGIGEMGVWLSGGQRQRIGIARALYKNPNVLILDEATSALDNIIETKIINSLFAYNKNMTIIFVTHRLSILSMCDKVLELKDGSISEIIKK